MESCNMWSFVASFFHLEWCFEVYECCIIYQGFVLFCFRMIFHYMDTTHFIYQFGLWGHLVVSTFFFFFFSFSGAAPTGHGGSQARDRIGAVADGAHHQAASTTYTTTHSSARSITHWARPGIKPVSSWMLVRFTSAKPWQELPPFVYCE